MIRSTAITIIITITTIAKITSTTVTVKTRTMTITTTKITRSGMQKRAITALMKRQFTTKS